MRAFLMVVVACGLVALPSAQSGQESGRSVGPLISRVTVEVFSDFQCPHCKMLHEQTIGKVKQEYAVKGRIRLVHRDFPLSMHAYAREAALFANAADRIGKYDQVADALFAQQDLWGTAGKVEATVDSVLTPAEAQKVREYVKDPALAEALQRDIDLGNRVKITATPTLIVTHDLKPERVTGFVSFGILSRFLDQLLAQ